NRGEFTRLDTAVYVNQVAQFADTFELGVASGAPGFSPCRGPASALGGQLIDQQFYGSAGIVTRNTTSYVSAVLVAGAATITICDNENQPVSPSTSTRGNVIITNPDVVFPNYDPDNDFYVSVISNFPNNDVLVEYTVHFEPRPADAA
ncbi:MAG TPA: hypothetical protein VFH47_03655, partial [Candidatus Thermoplasmatota archaeon]|nr:hypothetical protein [Candidatus Thermoplasmatota archaeon]